MVLHGIYATERIECDGGHFIELTKSADKPTFFVTCCCDLEWGYEFVMESNSDYEQIKWNVINAIMDCDTMAELLDELSDVFEADFADMIVDDECEFDCDGDCDHCMNNGYFN